MKPIQRRQSFEFGQPRFGCRTAPDRVDALAEVAVAQRAPGGAQGGLHRIELVQYLFARRAGLDHVDDGVQVPLGGAQAIGDRLS